MITIVKDTIIISERSPVCTGKLVTKQSFPQPVWCMGTMGVRCNQGTGIRGWCFRRRFRANIFESTQKFCGRNRWDFDNGVECFNSKDRNYAVTTNLSARVGRSNPSWHEPSDDETRNEPFRNAVVLTRTEFIQRVHGYLYDWLPAKEIVTKAITKSFEKGERILIFDDYCPWKSHTFDTENNY